MNAKERKRLIRTAHSFSERAEKKTPRSFDPEFTGRVMERLYSFSGQCEKCAEELQGLSATIHELDSKEGDLSRQHFRLLQQVMDRAVSHLQKKHKLAVTGQLLSYYLSLGIALGIPLGLTIFDNIAIGTALGIGIGFAIGSAQDSKAKKEDRVI